MASLQPLQIIDGSRKSSPRKPDEQWERLRPIISGKFKTESLQNVMEFMEQQHNFTASKRQYVYRLGNWGCTKYKKSNARVDPPPVAERVSDGNTVQGHLNPNGASSAVMQALPLQDVAGPVLASPTLATPNPDLREQPSCTRRSWALLADVLFAFGATDCSFDINVELRDAVASIRAAQSQAQDYVACELARDLLGTWPRYEQTWDTRFWDLALAHTWVRGSDAVNGMQQIRATLDIITIDDEFQDGEFEDRLQFLTPREPRLDIPTYIFLRSAMEWYNRKHEDEPFDVHSVLDQFIRQQLAPREPEHRAPPISINCISSCLAWCIDMLEHHQAIPLRVPSPHGNPTAESYVALSTLWHLWLSQVHPSTPNGQITPGAVVIPLPWADSAEPQLGIRPTELLSTVVCMIMAAVPPNLAQANNRPVLEKALAGAKALDNLGSNDDLLHRFLHQLWATNARLLAQPGEGREFHLRNGAVDAEEVEGYVRFAVEVLGLEGLTGVGEGAVVYPMVLAEVE